MFNNLKAFAGSFIERLDNKISSIGEDAKKEGSSSNIFQQETGKDFGLQTVRPLYEKKKNNKSEAKVPGLSLNLSQSMVESPNKNQTHSAGWFTSRNQSGNQIAHSYSVKESPVSSKIWDSNQLEEVIGESKLRKGFDEDFRKQLELTSIKLHRYKKTQPSETEFTEEDQDNLEENCELLQLMKYVIEANNRTVEADLNTDFMQGMSVYLINPTPEIFLAYLMSEKIDPILEDYGDDKRACESEIRSLLDDVNRKRLLVDRSIKNIVSKRNNDFWGTCEKFVDVCGTSDRLQDAASALRSKIEKTKREVVLKNAEMKKNYMERQKKEKLLAELEDLNSKYSNVFKLDRQFIITTDLRELPELYSRLLISLVDISSDITHKTYQSNNPLPLRIRSMVASSLLTLKSTLKKNLYLNLSIYNDQQDEPPHRELIDLLIVYSSVSDRYKKIASFDSKYDVQSEDSKLLKIHCCELYHADDSLSCIDNPLLDSFY